MSLQSLVLVIIIVIKFKCLSSSLTSKIDPRCRRLSVDNNICVLFPRLLFAFLVFCELKSNSYKSEYISLSIL